MSSVMKIRTTDKPWNKRRFARTLAAVLAFSVFLPVQVSAAEDETAVEAQTNENKLSYLELVDSFTTAERIPSKRLDTPANVTVITAAEIEANHYTSVAEALSHVNGSYILNGAGYTDLDNNVYGHPNGMHDQSLNGSQKTIILLNGRRTNFIPSIDAVERIEIVKGGASALYGSEAVGGVVNIITKKGEFNETTLDLSTGSWNQRNYRITNRGSDGKLGWFVAGSLNKSEPYYYRGERTYNYSGTVTDSDDNAFSVRLDNKFDDSSSLTLEFLHSTQNTNNYLQWKPLRGLSPEYGDLYNDVSLSYNFKEDTTTPGFLRYFNNYGKNFSFSRLFGNTRLQGVDYQNGWELGQHKIIAGVEWQRTEWQHILVDNNKMKVTNTAYYLQDTVSLGDKWTLIPGVRLDHNSAFGNQWSPKGAANYRADDKTKVYASWGRVYRAPTPKELYANKGIIFDEIYYDVAGIPFLQGSFWVGHSQLEPEKGHSESIGFEHDFDDRTNLTVDLFQNKIHGSLDTLEHMYWDYDYDNEIWLLEHTFDFSNAKDEKHRGIDISFRQAINEHFNYSLGYVHTHNEKEQPQGSTLYKAVVPPNSYRVGVHYDNRDVKANLSGRIGIGLDENIFLSNKYTVLDFNTSYDLTDSATLYFKFNNFTNQRYSHYAGGFPNPGRSVLVGAQFKF